MASKDTKQVINSLGSRPILVITWGDPAGIGPEILCKFFSQSQDKPSFLEGIDCVLCTSPAFVSHALSNLSLELEQQFEASIVVLSEEWYSAKIGQRDVFLKVPGANSLASLESKQGFGGGNAQLDLTPLQSKGQFWQNPQTISYGRIQVAAGLAAAWSVAEAVSLCLRFKSSVLVTPPLHKESLRAAGVSQFGHTELIADLCESDQALTMFQTGPLRIFFHSRHVSLKEACSLVKKQALLDTFKKAHRALIGLGLHRAKLAVAGLNPHCGEHGMFGSEEEAEIIPAIRAAKEEGVDIHGPIGADSVFHQAKLGQFDAVVALYHDQGHIAAKTLDFDRTVSFTLGLPFLRCSVDHGTAYDIAGKNLARETSMAEAILAATKYLMPS